MGWGFDGGSVLVTGGAGFVGSHLVERLLGEDGERSEADAEPDGTSVTVLDDGSTGDLDRIPDDATVIQGDVRDPMALDAAGDPDVIFHQAAVASVERSVETPLTTNHVNVRGTLAVLERAREADARVVLASSAAIYGRPDDVPIPEFAPKRPLSPYGVEKLACDRYVRAYVENYGLEAVALRYFNVYGPRGTTGSYAGVIGAFCRQQRAGGPLVVHGNGDQTRDFVHVSDVVEANLLAAEHGEPGEAYNVGTGDSTSIHELAEAVRELTGATVDIVHEDRRSGDIDHSRADVRKARTELGFEPRVGLEAGLQTVL